MINSQKLIRKLHQICFDKRIDIAVHYTVHVRSLVIGTVIFHAAVVEHVATDLRTPFDFLFAGFNLVDKKGEEERMKNAQGVFAAYDFQARLVAWKP